MSQERTSWTPYNAFRDNPVLNIDPTGALDEGSGGFFLLSPPVLLNPKAMAATQSVVQRFSNLEPASSYDYQRQPIASLFNDIGYYATPFKQMATLVDLEKSGDEKREALYAGLTPSRIGGVKPKISVKPYTTGNGRVTPQTRTKLAEDFYKSVGGDPIEIGGIDFDKAVNTTTLKKGTIVQQWVRKDGQPGSYFTEVGADPNKLGIKVKDRDLRTFELTEDVKVLQSTAADIEDHKGGAIQFYNPDLKNKVKEITGKP